MQRNRLFSVESDGQLWMGVWIYVSIMCLLCFVWLLWIWYDIDVHPTTFCLYDFKRISNILTHVCATDPI